MCVVAFACCLSTKPAAAQDGPRRLPDPLESETFSAAGALPIDQLDVWTTFQPRFSFVYDAGKGVGYRDSFTSLEAFVPFAQPSPNSLWFADFRGLFNNHGALGGNIGLGRRQFCPLLNATLGAYVYYDYRTTAVNQFQQISPGFEILTDRWDFRMQGYLPEMFGDRKTAPNRFHEHFLYIDRFETALTGADLELGVPLWQRGWGDPKLVGGCYYLYGPTRGSFWGWKARIEGNLTDAVSLRLAVQDDPVFNTTVNFAVAVRFGGGSLLSQRPLANVHRSLLSYSGPRSPHERLVDPVYRQQNIALDHEETLALDPDTDDPIDFLHVLRGGPGPGTFEDPYHLLTNALEDDRYLDGDIDVIYVRSGLKRFATHSDNVTLKERTQVLSNGPVQMVATQLGQSVLPLSGNDTDLLGLPIIKGNVTMAAFSKLSGFEIHPTGTGVTAAGKTDVTISENVVKRAAGDGIRLTSDGTAVMRNVAVAGNKISDSDNYGLWVAGANSTDVMTLENCRIDQNEISKSGDSGIRMWYTTFSGSMNENQIFDNGDHGIELRYTTFGGSINENRIAGNGLQGIQLSHGIYIDHIDFVGTIAGNTIDKNAYSALWVAESTFSGLVSDNIISGTFAGTYDAAHFSRIFQVEDGGISIDVDTDARARTGMFFTGSAVDSSSKIHNNQISNFGGDGIGVLLYQFDPGITPSFDAEISENTIDNVLYGIYISAQGPGTQGTTTGGDILHNTITRAADGITVNFFEDTASYRGDISFNQVSGMGRDGINVRVDSGDFTGDITNNIADNNGYSGIEVIIGLYGSSDSGSFTGNFTDNRANGTEGVTVDDDDGNPVEYGGDGIDIVAYEIEGDVARNVATDNKGNGLTVSAYDRFTGNFTHNRAERNNGRGIYLNTDNFSGPDDQIGEVSHNISNRNMATGIELLFDDIFDGVISHNTANNNRNSGIYADFDGDANGNLANNTTNGNGWSGMTIRLETLNGNITNNVAINNGWKAQYGADGIELLISESDTPETAGLIGDITGNNASGNNGAGIILWASSTPTSQYPRFHGNVTDNIAGHNVGTGINLGAPVFFEWSDSGFAEFKGEISGNLAKKNGDEGIALRVNPTAVDAKVHILKNTLSGNNSGTGREVAIANAGTGTLDLILRGNNSLNRSPNLDNPTQKPFNFDLLNEGGGTFSVNANVQDANKGTVGSSDGPAVVP